jgi:hypothetical protein
MLCHPQEAGLETLYAALLALKRAVPVWFIREFRSIFF